MSENEFNSRKKIIPESSHIGTNVSINCEHFEIGENCFIGNNVTINCRKFISGSYLYMTDGVEVAEGVALDRAQMLSSGTMSGSLKEQF